MTSVKWLTRIEAIAEPFTGNQMVKSYRYSRDREDPGEPAALIKPRALMIPHGIPDFATRLRIVTAGPALLQGRAWAGRVGIARVEVSADHGVTWTDADLDQPLSKLAWRGWSHLCDAPPGRHTLCVRATGADGAVQPTEQFWTHQGMGNNAVQSVDVLVL
jgi:DMSO/TMAO reductase YedYZ molybdopterin-dependent catalytic subunit